MSGDGDHGHAVSSRLGLARLAGEAIARTDGVSATSGPGGRWRTVGSHQTIAGVLAVEDAGGRVEIELHLLARWPPQASLEQLGERVRQQLRRFAEVAAVDGRLGAISVSFDDVLVEAQSG